MVDPFITMKVVLSRGRWPGPTDENILKALEEHRQKGLRWVEGQMLRVNPADEPAYWPIDPQFDHFGSLVARETPVSKAYNPAQPRILSGQGGGQWTSGGATSGTVTSSINELHPDLVTLTGLAMSTMTK